VAARQVAPLPVPCAAAGGQRASALHLFTSSISCSGSGSLMVSFGVQLTQKSSQPASSNAAEYMARLCCCKSSSLTDVDMISA
jgi:hypothetical protein